MQKELIKYIPQDIKIELNNGTLTLKSGSVITYPDGTQYQTTADKTLTISTNGTYFVLMQGVNFNAYVLVSRCGSGSTLPADSSTYAVFYNSTDGKIYSWNWGSSLWVVSNLALPLAIVTVSNGAISSIDQVFNGFGYIGSSDFILPDVIGYVPDGFDENGNAIFKEYSTKKLLVSQKGNGNPYLIANGEEYIGVMYFKEDFYQKSNNLYFKDGKKYLITPYSEGQNTIEYIKKKKGLVISQYANSPVFLKLANGTQDLFDDSEFVQNWYNVIFNLETATGYGLDVWGKILNRDRRFIYDGVEYYLKGAQTIDNVEFTDEEMENLYRKVLQLTAMRYIGNASIASINKMIQFIFDGKCYCLEYAPMQIRYVFRFYMNNVQKAIIETLNPHPTGVLSSFEYLPVGEYFGFIVDGKAQDEQPYLPFDNVPFYE